MGFRRLEADPPAAGSRKAPRGRGIGRGRDCGQSDDAGASAFADAVDVHCHGQDGLSSWREGFHGGGPVQRESGPRFRRHPTVPHAVGDARRARAEEPCHRMVRHAGRARAERQDGFEYVRPSQGCRSRRIARHLAATGAWNLLAGVAGRGARSAAGESVGNVRR